jgi:hypothetical protein
MEVPSFCLRLMRVVRGTHRNNRSYPIGVPGRTPGTIEAVRYRNVVICWPSTDMQAHDASPSQDAPQASSRREVYGVAASYPDIDGLLAGLAILAFYVHSQKAAPFGMRCE